MASSETAIQVAAMGRPFTLGMMYNARTEQLIPGMSLWDNETMDKYTTETGEPSSNFQVLASDTLESKTSMMDINASLKASFLAGLIEVSGSAKYLNDHKKYKNQCRATFQYQGSTDFRQLLLASLGPLNDTQKSLIDMNLATHVVTGIVYGANAFFAFDSEKLDSSSVQDIQGQMNAVMKKIPLFDVEGKVEIKLTEEEKTLTNKFSCTFFGDVLLESNPATFEEAVKTYVYLPKLLREKKDGVAPLKVWMLPLATIYPKAPVVPKNISIQLARVADEVLEDLRSYQIDCNEAQSAVVSKTFPDLGRMLSRFNNLCGYYIEFLQRSLSTKLPLIREGSEDEKELIDLFKKRDTSAFRHEKLSNWMDNKFREVTVIQSIVDMMDGTKVKLVEDQSELDKEVFNPNVHDALCYVFTSLEKEDPQLDDMEKYLDSPQHRAGNEVPWYFSPTVLSSMQKKAKTFHDIAAAVKDSRGVKFFMTALPNGKHEGATIYHYQNGALVSEDFSRPMPPEDPQKITNKQALMWYAVDLSFNPKTANTAIILSNNNDKATLGEDRLFPSIPERFDKVPQVMCTEGLNGHAYWEVEWSNDVDDSIAVAVTYKSIDRKAGYESWFGNNNFSWCFGKSDSVNIYFTGHNDIWANRPLPPSGINRLGVFLDWLGGTLSFYKVSSTELTHLHTFSDKFTAPLYPGCLLKSLGSFIHFCPVE